MTKTNSVRVNILKGALREISHKEWKDRIEIYELDFTGTPIEWGVNWSAMGTVPADEAVRFSKGLTKASSIAQMLTDMEIIIDWDAKEVEIKKEHVQRLKEWVEFALTTFGLEGFIKKWMEAY